MGASTKYQIHVKACKGFFIFLNKFWFEHNLVMNNNERGGGNYIMLQSSVQFTQFSSSATSILKTMIHKFLKIWDEFRFFYVPQILNEIFPKHKKTGME